MVASKTFSIIFNTEKKCFALTIITGIVKKYLKSYIKITKNIFQILSFSIIENILKNRVNIFSKCSYLIIFENIFVMVVLFKKQNYI